MELRTHLRILKQSRWFILLLTILVGLAACIFVLVRPLNYKAVVSFDVGLTNRPVTPDYQYGSYYDLKAAELYTQHLMSLLMTPAIVEEIYTTAGISYHIDSIDRFTHRFQTKQYSAQNFVVMFYDYNSETAKQLSEAIGQVIQKHSQTAISINDQSAFSVVALSPVIAESEYNIWMVTIVGIIAGFFTSIILVYIRHYLKD